MLSTMLVDDVASPLSLFPPPPPVTASTTLSLTPETAPLTPPTRTLPPSGFCFAPSLSALPEGLPSPTELSRSVSPPTLSLTPERARSPRLRASSCEALLNRSSSFDPDSLSISGHPPGEPLLEVFLADVFFAADRRVVDFFAGALLAVF